MFVSRIGVNAQNQQATRTGSRRPRIGRLSTAWHSPWSRDRPSRGCDDGPSVLARHAPPRSEHVAHEALVELVAEGDDELMSEFFETGTIGEEHIVAGIHNAIREDKLFPVLFASGLGNIGSDEILDFILDYVPSAVERKSVAGVSNTDSCHTRRGSARLNAAGNARSAWVSCGRATRRSSTRS